MTERAPYKIVIGVDFETTGDHALADALRLAREHPNDELHPVFVVKLSGDNHSSEELAKVSDEMEQAAQALRERTLNICAGLFPGEEWEQPMIFHVRLGDPAEAIHQVAVDYDANLIVVGTHGRKGLKKLVLGSVAEKLIETARCPVLVARERELEGLDKSDRPDAGRPGEDLRSGGLHRTELLKFGGRSSHISGLL